MKLLVVIVLVFVIASVCESRPSKLRSRSSGRVSNRLRENVVHEAEDKPLKTSADVEDQPKPAAKNLQSQSDQMDNVEDDLRTNRLKNLFQMLLKEVKDEKFQKPNEGSKFQDSVAQLPESLEDQSESLEESPKDETMVKDESKIDDVGDDDDESKVNAVSENEAKEDDHRLKDENKEKGAEEVESMPDDVDDDETMSDDVDDDETLTDDVDDDETVPDDVKDDETMPDDVDDDETMSDDDDETMPDDVGDDETMSDDEDDDDSMPYDVNDDNFSDDVDDDDNMLAGYALLRDVLMDHPDKVPAFILEEIAADDELH